MSDNAVISVGRTSDLTHANVEVENAPDHPEWDAFLVDTTGGDLVQSSAWGRIKQVWGMETTRLVVRSGPTIVGGVQLYVRNVPGLGRVAYMPYGPVCAPDASHRAVASLVEQIGVDCRRQRMRAVIAQPPEAGERVSAALSGLGFRTTDADVAPAATLRLDLRPGPDELLRRMSTQSRRDFRRSLRDPIGVRFGTRADLRSFHELYRCTAARHGFAPMSLPYLETVWDELRASNRIEVLLADFDGTDVAGNLVTCFGDVVTGRFLGFDPHRLPAKLRPNEVLVWTILGWAGAHGYRWLDVGGMPRADAVALASGVRPNGAPKSMKTGLGGSPVLYPEPVELIPNPILRAARRASQSVGPLRSLRHVVEKRARAGAEKGGGR